MGLVGQNAGAAPKQTINAAPPRNVPAQQAKSSTKLFGGGFKDALPPGVNGQFLAPGNYVLRINKCTMLAESEADLAANPNVYKKVSWKKRETFIAEAIVVESTPAADGQAATPAESPCCWVSVDGKFDYHTRDVKGFICAVLGSDDPAQVDEEDLKAFVRIQDDEEGPAQYAAGKLVRVMVRQKSTEKNGVFSQHLFSPYAVEA